MPLTVQIVSAERTVTQLLDHKLKCLSTNNNR